MKATIPLAVAFCALTGCDAFVNRRILVAADRPDEPRLLAAVRGYAAAVHLECRGDRAKPLVCARKPRRVIVVRERGRYVVCYSAIGAPFEISKFEKETQILAEVLRAEIGEGNVSVERTDAACGLSGMTAE